MRHIIVCTQYTNQHKAFSKAELYHLSFSRFSRFVCNPLCSTQWFQLALKGMGDMYVPGSPPSFFLGAEVNISIYTCKGESL